MNEPTLVAVAMVEHGHRGEEDPTFIITRRRAEDHLGGFWELPGGKVNPGEHPEVALRRELREELGIEVEAPELLVTSQHLYPDREVHLLFFVTATTPTSPEPQALASDEMRLLTIGEMLDLEWPPANEPLLEILRGAE